MVCATGERYSERDDSGAELAIRKLHIVKHNTDGSLQTWTDELPKMHSDRHNTVAESDALHNFYVSKFFTLIGSPVDPGEMPLPLQCVASALIKSILTNDAMLRRVIEEFAPQTGPMTVIVTSRCLTISAV